MGENGDWTFGQKAAAAAVGAVAVGGLGYLAYKHVSKSPAHNEAVSATSGEAAPGKARTPAVMKDEGNAAFKRGEYRKAIAAYTEAIESCHPQLAQERSTYFQNRAAAQEKLHNDDEVIADCTAALEANPQYLKAYSRRARAYERRLDYSAALKDFTAVAILENFQNYPTMEAADRVLKSLAQIKAKKLYAQREADGYVVPLSTSFVDSYLQSFAEDPILNSLPKAPLTSTSNGQANGEGQALDHVKALIVRKEYAAVVGEASRLLAEEKLSSMERLETHLLRATFSLIQGASKQATDDFQAVFKLIAELPDSQAKLARAFKVNGLVKRGSFYMQQGQKDECLQDFAEAEATDPGNADIYHHRGQLLILMGEGEKAKADFAKALRLRPDFEIARVQAAYADYRAAVGAGGSLAEITNAIVRFEALMREHPNCSEGSALLGQVYTERQAYAEATEAFEKAAALAPENANILVHQGLLILQRSEGNLDPAKAKMEAALAVDPACEFAYETLGTLEVQRGNVQAGCEHFDAALAHARTELELTHLVSLKEAALAQVSIARQLNIPMPQASA